MSRYLIYALSDPRTNEVRYVGRSSSGLYRPRMHFRNADHLAAKTYCANWVKGLVDAELEPQIDVLEEYDEKFGDMKRWLIDTETFWISCWKLMGARLTNLTDGGEGTVGFKFSTESRMKISAKKKGVPMSQKNRDALEGKWFGGREQCSVRATGRKMTDQTKTKISQSKVGKKPSSEVVKRRAESNRHARGPYKGKTSYCTERYAKIVSEKV